MWSVEKAVQWAAQYPWIAGFNYVPAYAVNSTQMWQEEDFDCPAIRKELAAAAVQGYNACRVFLPFIVWEHQHDAFMKNFRSFLELCGDLHLYVVPILFDDCAMSHQEPYMGTQREPVKGIHNSGWTPSPGHLVADVPEMQDKLRAYVIDLLTVFSGCPTILFWDLYNEPGNGGREESCLQLLHRVFQWAREADPSQPLTAGAYRWVDYDRECLGLSDIITFHDYLPLEQTREYVKPLLETGRPVYCTEWLHREAGSTFEDHLPYYRSSRIGVFQWGLVQGRTQTNLNWEPEKNCLDGQPQVWQHDVFHPDLTPYRPEEFEIFRDQLCLSMPHSKLTIPIVEMTPERMADLEKKGLIIRMAPGHHRIDIAEGEGIGEDLYHSSPCSGPHKLLAVSISRTEFSAFGFHEENEDFLLIGGVNERPMELLISYLTVDELRRKLTDGTVSADDFVCLHCKFNDPEVSFFTMKHGVPHGEAASNTNGQPATFYVTEPVNIHLFPIPLGQVERI